MTPVNVPVEPVTPPGALRTTVLVVRALAVPVGLPLLVLLTISTSLILPGPVIGTSASIGEELAFARVDGRDVVVLAYDDAGFGGLAGDGDARVTAIDLDRGETVWDEPLPDGRREPAVIAAGRRYTYVRHADGLDIVSLADGAVVAEAEDIEGLGEQRYDGFRLDRPYRYDRVRNTIVLLTRDHEVRAIPVDRTAAVPADPDLADTWSCLLEEDDEPAGTGFDQRIPEVTRPDGVTVVLRRPDDLPAGLPLARLYTVGPDGRGDELSATDFVEGGFLAAVTPADPSRGGCRDREWHEDLYPGHHSHAGTPSGHAVVVSRTDLNAETTTLTVVDLDSGEHTAGARLDDRVHRALPAPSGQLVITARTVLEGPLRVPAITSATDVVYIVDQRGGLRRVVVGEHGWFGRIRG